ncbi:hypothetical protein CVT24_010914 [Panaeolus cyanescens]|uniref:Uncharacterized protein n=1 Tax=Panaeolus cyanescens TaxID=181874 RepID=A0A409YVU9_9AGAR|nr:hypothetical protein CVT24_010914 [Panaeolus cyanescens]
MPKTRNVTKAQWDAANASRTSKRNHDENKVRHDEDKENAGRSATRSTRGLGRPVLGNVLGSTTAAGKDLKAKVPLKGKKTAVPKKKKLPLQDITHQFLPAPESENRGEEFRDIDTEENDERPANSIVATAPEAETIPSLPAAPPAAIQPTAPISPLPPSSPPPEWHSSPAEKSLPIASGSISGNRLSQNADLFGEWNEIPATQHRSDDVSTGSSGSDPFGFIALERDLKATRQSAASAQAPQHVDDAEDLGEILVADTSSPRPVRRLKRTHDEQPEACEQESDVAEDAPVVSTTTAAPLPYAQYQTPPTPHKDKQKRRRLSYPGHDLFEHCSSSAPSSPSPSKPSTKKKTPGAERDALDIFNERLERDPELTATQLRIPSRLIGLTTTTPVAAEPASQRVLRPRASTSAVSAPELDSPLKPMKKLPKKVKRPASAKKAKQPAKQKDEEDEAANEKYEQARQERIEYFKRLEGYEVETEDVYVI